MSEIFSFFMEIYKKVCYNELSIQITDMTNQMFEKRCSECR